ncbi:MAG: glycosyltransferase family 4 protein [Acidobacteria bacterium]|jgi:glycosyltransferase involved in cell wall biosynthesis|nr:glycosyltransferase family 4 protein [Acidobacteriota bacterium]
MNVLGLCSYPIESAATRYRLIQFVEPLAQKGINLEVSAFLDSEQFSLLYKNKSLFQKAFGIWKPLLHRFSESFEMRKYDLLLVQREAMFFGPAFFERLFQQIGQTPLILDLDDATYISYVSPTYGKLGSFFKFFGKTDNLISRADAVICGNRFIAEYVERKGTKTVVVPTVVDTDKFRPIEKGNEVPVIGWIGTHSTFPWLESLFPVLRELSKKYDFTLKIVGAGKDKVEVEGIALENLKWSLAREVEDFQSLDIGLYPIETSSSANQEWLLGKSGFKAIQYMSIGIPFVVTPIGVCAELGIENKTHFVASTEEQWFKALKELLESTELRRQMGSKGRKYALANFTVSQQADKVANVFRSAIEKGQQKIKT